ncbi:MAG: hypothetical protein EBS84_08135 [Proteobacteria bacterium]|nr:hypothetical protein [Verrucomicrobiota bacterium]NBU08967.1 hypothetical protein [Pseudomonadota bacterium]
MRPRLAKFTMTLLLASTAVHVCFAPDSVSLRIINETGSRIALEDPLTFNAGTIYQGLSALGHLDKTPRAERSTIDNRAFPATLESMTVATWPLLPGLTTKGMVAKPDDAAMMRRLQPGLTREANERLNRRVGYFPPVQDPDIIKPKFDRTLRQYAQNQPPDIIHPGTRPPSLTLDGYAWLRPQKPHIEEPNHERPQYDYSGPPLLFTAPAELLKNPLIANDPGMMRLFVRTNESGIRDTTAASVAAAKPVRRLRSASFWDAVEAPNNPRSDYDSASDYETKARNTTKALFDLRDPANPTSPNDPKPSYDTRPYFNPSGRRMLRDPNGN